MLDIELILERKAKIDDDVKVLIDSLKDTSIPVEFRWQNYEKLCNANLITNNDIYGDGFIDSLHPTHEFTLYDDFHCDRHETRSFLDMLETIEEKTAEARLHEGRSRTHRFKEIDLDAWKEKVLASGYASFTYDW